MQHNVTIIRSQIKRGPSEACASFSHKLNLENYGGPRFESVEFFASRKVQCAPDDIGRLTEELHDECVEEVDTKARQYILQMRRRQASKAERGAA